MGFFRQEPFDEVHVGAKSVTEGHPTHHVKALLSHESVRRNRQHEGPPARGLFQIVAIAHLKGQLKGALHLEDDASEQPHHALLASTTSGNPCMNGHHDGQTRRRIRRVHAKHQHHTQHGPHQADGPMGPERRAIAGVRGHVLQEGHQANGPVGHHEKHGDDLCHSIDVPHEHKAKAMAHVAKEARTGSLSGPLPCLSQEDSRSGKIPSAAMACRVRGATITDPKAELIAAAASPTGMMGPQMAMFCMYNSSVAKASRGALHQSLMATAM